MKIAIFENEYESVKGAFEVANLLEFGGQLDIQAFVSSQNARFQEIGMFDVIFIDIDLSSKSKLDGFGVIEEICEIDVNLINRIIILTGNNKIEEILSERNIPKDQLQIIIKPTDYEEISNSIKKIRKT